jgi:hypothetical protein
MTTCQYPGDATTCPVTVKPTPHVSVPSHPAPPSNSLAFTGSDVGGLAAIGLGFALIGATLVRRARRANHA